jgi:hypothetical protein
VTPHRARSLRGAFAAAALLVACGRTTGPEPIAWDEERCAHGRMLIGEPSFAAQLRSGDGSVESFDDPGCLLARRGGGLPRETWFHHLREERWIASDRVAFERVPPSPMGSGLGAVDAGSEGTLDLAAARREIAEREARR